MLNNPKISTPVLIEDLGRQYPTDTSKIQVRYGLYLCECGNKFKAQMPSINSGNTKSCGCYNIKMIKYTSTTHGQTNSLLYKKWRNIKNRCFREKDSHFKYYGARGITICDEWRNDFKAFHDWSIKNGYKEELQIDRINNDGNYEPSNCRFTTKSVQARNTRILKSNNTSGYRGVSFKKDVKKWYCTIQIENKNQIFLGYHKTAIEAALAYDNYVIINNLEHTRNFS